MQCAPSWLLQARVQVVVLPRAGLAELADIERKRKPALLVERREMRLHDVEERVAGRLQRRERPAACDGERAVDVGCIGAAVGDAPAVRRKRAHADAAERVDRLALGALFGEAAGELATEAWYV